MSNDLNKVILIGRLTKDPEMKYTAGGTAISNFSLANNYSYTSKGEKKESTSFFNCICWGKLGEIVTEHCRKGKLIAVEGRLQQRSWSDKDGNKRYSVEIVVDNFQFLSPKDKNATEYNNAQPELNTVEVEEQPSFPSENPFSSDDIPF